MARNTWTKKEDACIRRNYGKMDVFEIANRLNKSVTAVRTRARKLSGAIDYRNYKSNQWEFEHDLFLLNNHTALSVEALAKNLNCSTAYVSQRLKALNIRKKPPVKSSLNFVECKNPTCLSLIRLDTKVTCSKECDNAIRLRKVPSRKEVEILYRKGLPVDEIAAHFNISKDSMLKLMIRYQIKGAASLKTPPKSTDKTSYSRAGKRDDLGGVFVRSSWEANVLRWLNHQNRRWEFEAKTFYFDEIKRGTRSYTPDIWLIDEGLIIEVKGYLRPTDKTKVKRLRKYHPEEFAKLVAITKNKNVEATKFFKDQGVPILAYYEDLVSEYSNKLAHWET